MCNLNLLCTLNLYIYIVCIHIKYNQNAYLVDSNIWLKNNPNDNRQQILINSYIEPVDYVFSGSKYWSLQRGKGGSIVGYNLTKTHRSWWERFAFIRKKSIYIKHMDYRQMERRTTTIKAMENNSKSWKYQCLQRGILICWKYWIFPSKQYYFLWSKWWRIFKVSRNVPIFQDDVLLIYNFIKTALDCWSSPFKVLYIT